MGWKGPRYILNVWIRNNPLPLPGNLNRIFRSSSLQLCYYSDLAISVPITTLVCLQNLPIYSHPKLKMGSHYFNLNFANAKSFYLTNTKVSITCSGHCFFLNASWQTGSWPIRPACALHATSKDHHHHHHQCSHREGRDVLPVEGLVLSEAKATENRWSFGEIIWHNGNLILLCKPKLLPPPLTLEWKRQSRKHRRWPRWEVNIL